MKDILRRAHRTGDVPAGAASPDDLWVRCPKCKELLYKRELEQNLLVCSKCKYHFHVTAPQRIAMTADEGTFQEIDSDLPAVDPLHFVSGKKTYREKLDETVASTGQNEGFLYGPALLDGMPVVLGAIEFEFIAGSMGSIVGEKVTRAMEKSIESRLPLVLFSTSGGARMQEGILSLMQMPKVLGRLDDMADSRLPYISVMTDPCYGGVTASFAMLGDVNIGEPGAFIGFAGPRVIEQTTRERLPPGAASSEFLLQHGMLDLVVPRGDMKLTLARLLRIYTGRSTDESKADLNGNSSTREDKVGDGLRVGL
jgi:acetyl-CoA carboxylase carboxyl transferase subunit beta